MSCAALGLPFQEGGRTPFLTILFHLSNPDRAHTMVTISSHIFIFKNVGTLLHGMHLRNQITGFHLNLRVQS